MDEQTELAGFLATAVEAAKAGGTIACEAFRQPRQIRFKGPKDIVTEVDVASEKAIIDLLQARYPAHDILSEERGQIDSSEATNTYTWIIDPIDGTNNYATELPFWCISVALVQGRQPIAAAVYDPIHEELFTAVRGQGAKLNDVAIHVRDAELNEGLVAADIGYDEILSRRAMNVAVELRPHVQRIRVLGSAVLATTYVAAGRLDLFFHLNLKPWDMAAALLLLREAGGVATDFAGQPCDAYSKELVAANPKLHRSFLNLPHVEQTAHQS